MIAHSTQPPKPNECDSCDDSPTEYTYGFWFCEACANRERRAREIKKPEDIIANSKLRDTAIKLGKDVYNAEVVSIDELRQAVEADSSVENKRFKLAELILERMAQYKKAIFEASSAMHENTNKQVAAQAQLNLLANTLRAEEREKLKIADINYVPKLQPIKTSTLNNKKQKLDKVEIKRVAIELGLPESTITMFCVSKNLTPLEAGNLLRRTMAEAKSAQSNSEVKKND